VTQDDKKDGSWTTYIRNITIDRGY